MKLIYEYLSPCYIELCPRAKFLWSIATLKARKPRRRWNGGGRVLPPTESSWKKRKKRAGRWQNGCSFSEELLRVAYVTAISFIPRFIFLAPCYIPPTLRPPASPRTTITSTPTNRPLSHGGKGCRQEYRTPSPTLVDPWKLHEEFFFHIHQGVIVRRNPTNFQPPNLREIYPHSPKRAFKSSWNLAQELGPILPRAASRHPSSSSTPIHHSTPDYSTKNMVDRHDRPGTDSFHAQFTVSHFIPIARSTAGGWSARGRTPPG